MASKHINDPAASAESPDLASAAGYPNSSSVSSQQPEARAPHLAGSTMIPSKHHGHAGSGSQVPASGTGNTSHTLQVNQDGLDTEAKLSHDGRINININQRTRRFSSLFGPVLRDRLGQHEGDKPFDVHDPASILPSLAAKQRRAPPPPMNIVIQIVGSRGDVQPFVALGQTLKNKYGHRVRLATHATFKQFVEENGLEFFNIGGDPAELMAFMVKNPGLMPGFETLRNGDVGKRRKGIYEILKGCWRSCIEAGDGMDVSARRGKSDDTATIDSDVHLRTDSSARPFVADVIIANPPTFAHVHCAEKLGVPLHMMFTMPWSPTQAFPHPLANIQSSNADASLTNFVSYSLVEMMTWQGLGDLINRFREHTLRLEPVSIMWAPGMLSRLRIPSTYCWSPALIPKPKDWGSHINIAGFYFLSLASSYTPDPELVAFLEAGPPPVYIGFGSIVVDDPNALTNLIFEAIKKAGVRALVSKGWGGLGTDELGMPEGVYMLGNVPHDWLFKHVSAVVHHGGAGTTAAGVALGRPTVVVPFFGDQPWWGSMIARAGAGPEPIPYKQLTADNLAAAITEALQPSTLTKAAAMGETISQEAGTEIGAASFHSQLNIDHMRCSLAPSRTAVWRVKRTQVRLSALAAAVLGREGLLEFHDLKLYRSMEYESETGPWDPISGGASALMGTVGSLMFGVADFPIEVVKALTSKRPENGTDGMSRTNTASSLTRHGSTSTPPPSRAISHSQPPCDNSANVANGLRPTSSDVPRSAASRSHTTDDREASNTSETTAHPHMSPDPESPPETPHVPRADTIAQVLVRHLAHNHTVDRMISGNQGLFEHPDCPACKSAQQAAVQAGHSIGRVVEAGLRSPVDFTMALARGFHNAPKLYGDKTVRTPEKVTGLPSGLKTAGMEFGQGLYDGITGLVTQPYQGAKAEGAVGFMKGIGRGFGGLILKPQAAAWALPGYTFDGLYKELRKLFGSRTESYIIAARTAQGHEDLLQSTAEEREEIITRWKSIQDDVRKAQQTLAEETRQTMAEYKVKRQQTFEAYKQRRKEEHEHHHEHKHEKDAHEDSHRGPLHGLFHSRHRSHHSHPSDAAPHNDAAPEELEEAVKASVAATSKGDPVQDEMIERAVRASLAALQKARHADVDDQEALDRAVRASIAELRKADAVSKDEATSPTSSTPATTTTESTGTTMPEDDELLKEALQLSLQAHDFPAPAPGVEHGDGDHAVVGGDMPSRERVEKQEGV